MIKVINEIKIFSDEGGHDEHEEKKLHITNHPMDDTMVILVINGKEYKVVARDLEAAVTNAVNCARH